MATFSTINKSPGVIVQSNPPEAVAPAQLGTGEGAILCVTQKGPLYATRVSSFAEWVSMYGTQLPDLDANGNYKYPAYQQLKNYFSNGGAGLWTKRVVHYTDITDPDTATCEAASVTLRDGNVAVAATIGTATADAGNGGSTTAASSGTYTGVLDGTYTVEVTTAGVIDGGTAVVTITGSGNEEHAVATTIQPTTAVAFAVGTKGVMLTLTDAGAVTLGDKWTIAVTGAGYQCLKVSSKYCGAYANKATLVALSSGLSVKLAVGSIAGTYALTEVVDGVNSRTFDLLENDSESDNYVIDEINSAIGSQVIEVTVLKTTTPVVTYTGEIPLIGGDSGLTGLVNDDYIGDQDAETGIHGFDVVSNILIVGCPEKEGEITVMQKLIDWADFDTGQHPYSFIIHSLAYTNTYTTAKVYHGTTLAKDNYDYALYFPWIKTNDVWVSPTMAIAGCYVRNDVLPSRGVWWSPAGYEMDLRNVQDVQYIIGESKGGVLNTNKINVIRPFTGFGLLIWGSRTGTTTKEKYFKYIGAVRNTKYVSATLKASTAFSTHHEAGPSLWRKVASVSESFLFAHWRAGGFRGDSASEAYTVVINAGNNTPDLEEQGITVLDVGMWNKKTNEFLFIRIDQK